MSLIRTAAEAREETIAAGVAHMLADTDVLVEMLDDILAEEGLRRDVMTKALRTLADPESSALYQHHALDMMAAVFVRQAHERAERQLGIYHLV